MRAYCSIRHPCSSKLRKRMIHLGSPHGLQHAHVAKFVVVGHVGQGAKEPTADAPQGSATNAGGAAANSCKGWSPTQRTGMLICWHCVSRSTSRFLIRQLEIDLDESV